MVVDGGAWWRHCHVSGSEVEVHELGEEVHHEGAKDVRPVRDHSQTVALLQRRVRTKNAIRMKLSSCILQISKPLPPPSINLENISVRPLIVNGP